ncbi:phosphate signaling complex protein PhoU [Rhizohabitans arisaemae]|uniref:phosphate signaling complex protein PhoU n=1 Tax=Rhizohabitans arisaemae TaxID=2720610 RepID=UPI0024B19FAB|nr:phosphate signaling complex protein PhoU [Rhizohabitans arisaemae]
MRDTYHDELDALTHRLVEMAALVRSAMADATTALLDADLRTAEAVISGDTEVNRLFTEIEASILELMARQQPVARDLRMVITALRMATDLERMGDMAEHVAKIARLRYPDSAVPPELHPAIREMGRIAEGLVAKAGSVVRTRDVATALELETDDDAMDGLHRELLTRLLAKDWPHGVEPAVDVTLTGRYYERYADHAVRIAQSVVYLVTGSHAADAAVTSPGF